MNIPFLRYFKRDRRVATAVAEPPKPPGYWKWEATVTQTGACELPRADQIEMYLAETLHTLER